MVFPSSQVEATLNARRALMHEIESEIGALKQLRALRRFGEVSFFVLVWAGGIASMLTRTLPAQIVGVAASAIALNGFFLLSHEGHHNLLSRSARLGRLLTAALCTPLVHSATAYRVLHELHHRYLGGPGDPDEYRNYTRRPSVLWLMHWARLTAAPLLYVPLIPIVAFMRAERADRGRIAAECAVIAAAATGAWLIVPRTAVILCWLLPALVVGYISAVRALAQHALTDAADPLLASRSVQTNPVVAFLLLNENHHLEHHLFPDVPSYNLPQLQALLRKRAAHRVVAPSYTRFLADFTRRFLAGDDAPLGVITP